MSGADYLTAIKNELAAGRHQHRMGENVLAAFGYIRRRRTAVEDINRELERLGLLADPPITQEMPLRTPRIRFSLATSDVATAVEAQLDESAAAENGPDIEPELVTDTLTSSFRIAELDAADQPVEWVAPTAPISEAYTKMSLKKYSQLLVANGPQPRRQDVKGIVSYQSIAKALIAGGVSKVGDCVDDSVPIVRSDADLGAVLPQLGTHDVVLVAGTDHRIQGIVTAWDLAEEFAQLVDPFKRIGEVEARLRAVLGKKLGADCVNQFLSDHPNSAGGAHNGSLDELTIGDLQRIIEHPDHWSNLGLVALDKATFAAALDRMRVFRNRLMHFRDPLSKDETVELTNFCELVREIPL